MSSYLNHSGEDYSENTASRDHASFPNQLSAVVFFSHHQTSTTTDKNGQNMLLRFAEDAALLIGDCITLTSHPCIATNPMSPFSLASFTLAPFAAAAASSDIASTYQIFWFQWRQTLLSPCVVAKQTVFLYWRQRRLTISSAALLFIVNFLVHTHFLYRRITSSPHKWALPGCAFPWRRA